MKVERLKNWGWEEFGPVFLEALANDFASLSPNARQFMLERTFKLKNLQWRCGQGRKLVWLAKENNLIVGFLVATKVSGGVQFLNWVWVGKDWRGKGLGRRLMETWAMMASTNGAHKLNVTTTEKANVSFYEKMGFKIEGIKKQDRWGQDRHLLGKILKKYPGEK